MPFNETAGGTARWSRTEERAHTQKITDRAYPLVGTAAGSTYSGEEYETWLRAAGFQAVKQIRLPGPSSLIVAARPD